MSATFSRLKTWVAEKLNASDLNAEIDNILTNLSPSGMSGSSANVAGMQVQTDPGEVGTESLATTLAGEIERLRYEVAQIKGETYWYSSQDNDLASLNTEIGVILNSLGQQDTRISSGETVTGSSQSLLLTPEGAAVGNNLTVNATTTPLIYYISGTKYTASTDVTLSFTTTPPTSNNTALADSTGYVDADDDKRVGERDRGIRMGTIGSEISSLEGKIAAFRLDTAADSEYLLARVNGLYLEEVKRGWFFDESGVGGIPITFAQNDTLTLMEITWMFLDTTQTILSVNNEPVISEAEPSAPANGDFWYDTNAKIWNSYNGTTWVDTESIYLGIAIQDENGDCVGARSEDFAVPYSRTNTLTLNYDSTSVISARPFGAVRVGEENLSYFQTAPEWDMAVHLDTGITEAASTRYFFYIKENGETVISDVAPLMFNGRDRSFYHRHHIWRCLGHIDNDGSSDFDQDSMDTYLETPLIREERFVYGGTSGSYVNTTQASNTTLSACTTNFQVRRGPVLVMLVSDGTANTARWGPYTDGGSAAARAGTLTLWRDGVQISTNYMSIAHTTIASGAVYAPVSCAFLDTPTRGTVTYEIKTNPDTNSYFLVEYMRLLVVEL